MLKLYIAPDGKDKQDGSIESPVKSPQRALELYLKKRSLQNTTIYFREGCYYFDETLVVGKIHEPLAGTTLTLRAWKDETVVLSGGKKISTWKQTEHQNGAIWSADIPWASNKTTGFHVLYDDGRLMTRASSHKSIDDGYETTKRSQKAFPTDFCTSKKNRTELHFPDNAFEKWENLQDIEMVISPQRPWLINYLSIESVDLDNNISKITPQATYELKGRFCLENHLEFITSPGEWALDTIQKKCFYWPPNGRPGDDIIAPTLKELIRIEGDNSPNHQDDPVRNIHISDLTLMHCDRDVHTPDDKGIQHDWSMWGKGSALVRFRGAESCRLKNCTLKNTGSDGVRMDLYCQQIEVENNIISHTGGMGVLMAGYGPGYKDVNKFNRVVNNDISNTGTLYPHSMGIMIWQSGENHIAHNHIHELGYMGIVVSGVRRRFWDENLRPRDIRELVGLIDYEATSHLEGGKKHWKEYSPYMHAKNNLIEYNEIHDCMKKLADGNAIYLSGTGPHNIVRNNLVYHHSRDFLLRTDDDQFDSIWENNILIGHQSNARGFTHKGANTFNNNILINCNLCIYMGVHGPSENIHSIQRNVIYFNSPVSNGLLHGGEELDPQNIDHNLYYSKDKASICKFLENRQHHQSDINSIVADPKFRNIIELDFYIASESVLKSIGFQNIDFDRIGLMSQPSFTRLRHEGQVKINGAVSLEEMIV